MRGEKSKAKKSVKTDPEFHRGVVSRHPDGLHCTEKNTPKNFRQHYEEGREKTIAIHHPRCVREKNRTVGGINRPKLLMSGHLGYKGARMRLKEQKL